MILGLFIAGIVAILIVTKFYSGLEYDTSDKDITIIKRLSKISVGAVITLFSIGFCIQRGILLTSWGFFPLAFLICTIADYVLMLNIMIGSCLFAAGYLLFPIGLFFISGSGYIFNQPTIFISVIFIVTLIYLLPSVEKEVKEPLVLYSFVQYMLMTVACNNSVITNNYFIAVAAILIFFSDFMIVVNQYKYKIKYNTYIVMSTYWVGLYSAMWYLITMNK